MLHAALVRSPAAAAAGARGPNLEPTKWTSVIQHKFLNPQQPLLAHDKLRHVGEAIAIIVAESRK
jgi:CO/xanthine dehydrogenase Mo-binding subunit